LGVDKIDIGAKSQYDFEISFDISCFTFLTS
jgi:hypothetical protein